MEKRTIQDWLVAPRLRTVPGVTEVNSFGGEVKQYQVVVRPESLVQYRLTLREVLEALERGNGNAGAGYIVKGWEQTTIRGVGLFGRAEDIESVVLKSTDGTPVLVRDVAEVRVGPQLRQGAVTRDGRGETVAGMAIMLRGENSRTVVTAVKEKIEELRKGLPKGLRIDVFYDRTELVEACIATVTNALLEGGILVVLVLFLFLAELPDGGRRRRVAPDHVPPHVHRHGRLRALVEPDEPRRARVLRRHGRRRVDRRRRERPAPPRREP